MTRPPVWDIPYPAKYRTLEHLTSPALVTYLHEMGGPVTLPVEGWTVHLHDYSAKWGGVLRLRAPDGTLYYTDVTYCATLGHYQHRAKLLAVGVAESGRDWQADRITSDYLSSGAWMRTWRRARSKWLREARKNPKVRARCDARTLRESKRNADRRQKAIELGRQAQKDLAAFVDALVAQVDTAPATSYRSFTDFYTLGRKVRTPKQETK